MPSFQDGHSELQKEIDRRVRQRVLDGIQLLKEKHGEDWVDFIDLEHFNLKSGSACVLGQVYGSWEAGCEILGIKDEDGLYGFSDLGIGDLVEEVYGVTDYGWNPIWEDFEKLWRQQIAALQRDRKEVVV